MDDNFHEKAQKHIELENKARRILGVSADADEIEIKKAFWLGAITCHPDKYGGDQKHIERFKNIVNAYRFLTKGETPNHLSEDQKTNKIGSFLANDWGYFSWWRESFMVQAGFAGIQDPEPRRVAKTKRKH